MTIFDRIKTLADKRKISLQKVAIELGFSENYIYNLKYKKSPSAEHLAKLADYFHVTVDFLLGREEPPEKSTVDLTEVAESENWDNWLSAGGKPLTDNDKKLLKAMFGDD